MQNKIQKLFFFDRTFQIQNTALEFLPYKFTAKELDEETGLYYYGARYLDPKYSMWLSCDPALDEYMSGSDAGCGGAYNSVNLNLYHYAWNNPVKYTDPNGEFIFLAIPVATMAAKAVAWFVGSLAICAVGGYVIGKTAENAVEYAKSKNSEKPSPMPENGAESAAVGSPMPPDDEDDDFDNDDYEYTQRIGRNNGKTPRNNQVQNQQVKNISKKYKLTKEEQEQLHDEITHQGYNYSEVEKIAQEIVKERGL